MGQPLSVWLAYEQASPILFGRAVNAVAFIIQTNFLTEDYNYFTLNATVREIVEVIREFVPNVELSFVDSPIMNQLSYEGSPQRFLGQGFAY